DAALAQADDVLQQPAFFQRESGLCRRHRIEHIPELGTDVARLHAEKNAQYAAEPAFPVAAWLERDGQVARIEWRAVRIGAGTVAFGHGVKRHPAHRRDRDRGYAGRAGCLAREIPSLRPRTRFDDRSPSDADSRAPRDGRDDGAPACPPPTLRAPASRRQSRYRQAGAEHRHLLVRRRERTARWSACRARAIAG